MKCYPQKLSQGTYSRIRSLQIQKRRKRGKKGGIRHKFHFNSRGQQVRVHAPLLKWINTDCGPSYVSKLCRNQDSVQCLLLNCQSLRNKDVTLHQFLDSSGLHMCFLTETWINDSDKAFMEGSCLSTNGWKTQFVNRDRQGGGLALVYKDFFHAELIPPPCQYSTFEYASWKITLKSVTIFPVIIYHHPTRPGLTINRFLDEFSDFVDHHLAPLQGAFILGDFNIATNDHTDPDVTMYLDLMTVLGFSQQVFFTTHNKGNILDHIFTDPLSVVKLVNVSQGPFMSDHCIVLFTLIAQKQKSIPIKKSVRSTKDLKENANFKELLCSMLDKIDLSQSLDVIVKHFKLIMETLMDIYAPIKVKTITTRRKEVWFNRDIAHLKRLSWKYERIWKKSLSDRSWEHFRFVRKSYQYAIRKEKRKCIGHKILTMQGNIKALYNFVQQITGTVTENPLPKGHTDEELAELFADFFMEKIVNIRKSLEHHPKYIPQERIVSQTRDHFCPVTPQDVRTAINSLATKSCELDFVPTLLLKDCVDLFLPILTHIFNLSLNTGKFIMDWAHAKIRPLIKKPGLLIDKNYRPVSNLSFLGKSLEKLVIHQLTNHMEQHAPLPDHQSAYRKGHSCETALAKFANDCLWSMENHEINAILCLDLSAAFDTVDHDILQVLQSQFGVTGTSLDWFQSYLHPRTCAVTVGNAESSPRGLPFSVPQGSCLGPILFTAYTASLGSCPDERISGLYGYADDHSLRTTFDPAHQDSERFAYHALEHSMENIQSWMDSNRLKLNPDKTEFIYIGSCGLLSKAEYQQCSFLGQTILRSMSIKLLGVTFDQHLSLNVHITQKCRIAVLNLRRIQRIHSVLSIETCKILVQALVISHLDHCNVLYINLPQCQIRKLQ